MSTKWSSAEGKVNRVKALLENAGVPLELQAADICQTFCDARSNEYSPREDYQGSGAITQLSEDYIALTTEKIVYSSPATENEYREIDQCLQIRQTFQIGEFTNVLLTVKCPIECKYRKDVVVFAFPLSDEKSLERFPLHDAFTKGSAYFASLHTTYEVFSKLVASSLVALEIKDGDQPSRVFEENLTYNAAGALYDFILFDLAPEGESESPLLGLTTQALDETGLFKRFIEYAGGIYDWWSVLDNWTSSNLREDDFIEFNKRVLPSGARILHTITAHVPIICVNGSLHSVSWSSSLGISDFAEIPFCVTSIRKRGWPGRVASGLMNTRPELPVVITNPENLTRALEVAHDWHRAIYKEIKSVSTSQVNRWLLEASLYQKAREHFRQFASRAGYRSDLEYGSFGIY
jgi:hypothetical protein